MKKGTLIPSSELASLLTPLYLLASGLTYHLGSNSAEVSGSHRRKGNHFTAQLLRLMVQICYEHLTEKLKNNAIFYYRTLDVFDAKNSCFQ